MMMHLEDEGPTAMMNNMMDTNLEMVKMVFGGDCPDGFWDKKQRLHNMSGTDLIQYFFNRLKSIDQAELCYSGEKNTYSFIYIYI